MSRTYYYDHKIPEAYQRQLAAKQSILTAKPSYAKKDLNCTNQKRRREKQEPLSVVVFLRLEKYVLQHNRIGISEFITIFAVADRLADHASRVRFIRTNPRSGVKRSGM